MSGLRRKDQKNLNKRLVTKKRRSRDQETKEGFNIVNM